MEQSREAAQTSITDRIQRLATATKPAEVGVGKTELAAVLEAVKAALGTEEH